MFIKLQYLFLQLGRSAVIRKEATRWSSTTSRGPLRPLFKQEPLPAAKDALEATPALIDEVRGFLNPFP